MKFRYSVLTIIESQLLRSPNSSPLLTSWNHGCHTLELACALICLERLSEERKVPISFERAGFHKCLVQQYNSESFC